MKHISEVCKSVSAHKGSHSYMLSRDYDAIVDKLANIAFCVIQGFKRFQTDFLWVQTIFSNKYQRGL